MTKILMSIRPEWSAKILNGEKTEEIRKNLGKLTPPFKVYAYVTKGKPYLLRETTYFSRMDGLRWEETKVNSYDKLNLKYAPFFSDTKPLLNGKVVCEFVVDRVYQIGVSYDGYIHNGTEKISDIMKNACLSFEQFDGYLYSRACKKMPCAYSLHITQLNVYDKPKELGEFHSVSKVYRDDGSYWVSCFPITKAPQSWCKVEELKDE